MNLPRTAVYWVMADVSETSAGYRLRIRPLIEKISASGVTITIISEQELAKQIKKIAEEAHTVISSKPGNIRIFLCLKYLAQQNIKIIVDLFDNYFSWSPTLFQYGAYWNWPRVLQVASRVCVSTRFLQNTLLQLNASNVCLIPDPLPPVAHELASYFTDNGKWQDITCIELLWFGINSNPYFQAGLEDLITWMPYIVKICANLQHQFDIRITICTKRVPEVETVLHELRQRALYGRFVEWTEEVCEELIEQSHVVLIPSNLTGFSLSKTHNRCSDALARGCLVLSSPNGPYYNIPGGVLSSVTELCQLLLTKQPLAIQSKLQQSLDFIEQDCDVDLIARLGLENNSDLVVSASSRPINNNPVLVLTQTKTDTAKLSRNLGYLVASFKNSGVNANCDIYLESFDAENSTILLKLTKGAYDYFANLIMSNIALEWSGNKKELRFLSNGWSFVFKLEALTCIAQSDQASDLLLKLAISKQINQQHPCHQGFWYAENTELLCLILVNLGANSIDFASDGSYGWKEFAETLDSNLNDSAKKLKQLWLEYQSNELQLGRPDAQSYL